MIALASLSFLVPFVPGRIQNPEQDRPAVQSLAEAIVGDWRGLLIVNDRTRNFLLTRARLRFTRYGTVFYDREAILPSPPVRDWRADYEVVGTAIYMNPHNAPSGIAGPVVFSGVSVGNGRLEAVVLPNGTFDLDVGPFGKIPAIATALRMEKE